MLRQSDSRKETDMSWLAYALISAAAAAVTAILAKLGVEGVPSALATAIRTLVVVVGAWTVVLGLDQHRALSTISARSVIFLALSGVATAASWLAYFHAFRQAQPAIYDRAGGPTPARSRNLASGGGRDADGDWSVITRA
jgi:drug/metabolite transporter (DMT)-like permease